MIDTNYYCDKCGKFIINKKDRINGDLYRDGGRRMTCKDCIYYGVCAIQLAEADAFHGKKLPLNRSSDVENKCFSFEDRSRFVKLPCSTNETLFIIDDSGEIIIDKVETIVTIGYDEDFSQSQLDCYSGKQYYARDIGKTIFFTKEEAEEELKKKETKND